MIEVIAAVIGAAMGIGAAGLSGFMRQDKEGAMAVVRLTTAVEHIAGEVSLLRQEIKEDRQELFGRVNGIEQRLATLEARSNR